jgi:hypothetical protein
MGVPPPVLISAQQRTGTNGQLLNYVHGRHPEPVAHGSLQSENPLRLQKMHIRRTQRRRDNLPDHRVKGDKQRVRNQLQHEFTAGAQALQMVQSIL